MQDPEVKVEVNCKSYGLLKSNSLASSSLNVENSDIFIFKIHLPDHIAAIEDLSLFLKPEETIRANRYFKEKDKNRFIICRGLLKLVLSYYTKLDVKQIKINYLSNKKPYLPSHPSLFFNISHSGDYALIALANRSIGIDIEHINEDYDFTNLLKDIFNDTEIAFIENASDKKQAFYSLWTRKEAFVKALGKGIDNDFSKIPSIDGLHTTYASLINSKESWQIQGFKIDNNNYSGAVASEENQNASKNIEVFSMSNNIKTLMAFVNKKKG